MSAEAARVRPDSVTPWPQSRRRTVIRLSLPWREKARHSDTARTSFLNDLKRLTSIQQVVTQNHFLESLPRATKIFLLASILDAIFIMALSIEQLVVGGDVLHVLIAMLVTSIFFSWFVISAIIHENAYELLITVVLSAVIAIRTLYYVATKNRSPGEVAAAVLAILLTAVCSLLALVSYRQFGWRQHSRLACDLRVKSASSRQHSQILVKRFLALIKLDLLFLIILSVLGLNVATSTGRNQRDNLPLIITNAGGLVINLLWIVLAYWTVLNEHCRAAGALQVCLAPCFGMPIIDIVLSFVKVAPIAPKTRETLLLSALVFIIIRLLGAVVVLQCIAQFRRLRREYRSLKAKEPGTPVVAEDIPPELTPLIQGAWIGKPSPGAPKKRRFFQLSSDGSTLRWAWDKYIVLYYVEEQMNDDEEWEIRLRLLSAQDQPDLLLRFQDLQQYVTWKRGLALTLTLLFSPSGLAPGSHGAGREQPPLSKSRAQIVHQLLEATNDTVRVSPRRLLRQLSGQISRRSSITDPDNVQFQRLAAATPALQYPLRSPTQSRQSDTNGATGVDGTQPEGSELGPRCSAVPMQSLDDAKDHLDHEDGLQCKPSSSRLARQISATVPSLRGVLFSQRSIPEDASVDDDADLGSLLRTNSLPSAGNVREVVFEQLSPRGMHVRMRITHPQHSLEPDFVLGPPPPPRRPKKPAESAPVHAKPIAGAESPTAAAEQRLRAHHSEAASCQPQESTARPTRPQADGVAQERKAGKTAGFGAVELHADCRQTVAASALEEVDVREYLDKVGPLPGLDKRTDGTEAAAARDQGEVAAAGLIEVVVAKPPAPDPHEPRLDATARAHSDISSTAETVHRRTQTSSSGESFTDGVIFARRHGYKSSGDTTTSTSGSGSEWGQLTTQSTGGSSLACSFPVTLKVSIEIIEYEDLCFGKFLGQGAEGSVYAAWYMDTPVAVKQTDSISEIEMNLHAGSHDNIVALRGLCQHQGKLFLVMEYCPRGTLDLLLHHTPVKRWDPAPLLRLVRSIARGMLHLHTRKPPILHRDLKPANIFVGHGLIMKIGDFGMSRHVLDRAPADGLRAGLEKSLTAGTIGTAAYCAPEVLDVASPASGATAQVTLKSDVYSFGVLLWEILLRRRPYDGMDGFQIQTRWYMGDDMSLPPVPVPAEGPGQATMAALAALVADCTQLDPARRPSFKGILDKLRPLGGGPTTMLPANSCPV